MSKPNRVSVLLLAATLCSLFPLAGCDAPRPGSKSAASQVGVFDEYDYETPVDLARGKTIYARHCAGCHGDEGDGKGPAAAWLNPKPRNFKLANFKFSSVAAGRLPTDGDIHRTLFHGANGTSMPEWSLLPEPDRAAVVAYLKTFSERWTDPAEMDAPIAIGADPYAEDPIQGILDGEIVYHTVATCWECHPAYASEKAVKGFYEMEELAVPSGIREGYERSVAHLVSTEGEKLHPPDFTWDYIKSGTDTTELYKRIAGGISGTSMPTWPLPAEDLWAMAYYVRYLAEEHRVFPRAPKDRRPFAELHPDGVYNLLVPEEEQDAAAE